jgi:hypothetical protein
VPPGSGCIDARCVGRRSGWQRSLSQVHALHFELIKTVRYCHTGIRRIPVERLPGQGILGPRLSSPMKHGQSADSTVVMAPGGPMAETVSPGTTDAAQREPGPSPPRPNSRSRTLVRGEKSLGVVTAHRSGTLVGHDQHQILAGKAVQGARRFGDE